MRRTRTDIMGMPITIDLVEGTEEAIGAAFDRLAAIDARFSTYKEDSEISRFNRGEISESDLSDEARVIFALADRTREETGGYFDMRTPEGLVDPSGVVKGWAIEEAGALLSARGHRDYLVEAAGDIATAGRNEEEKPWAIGIRNPFAREEVVKVVYPRGSGIATSGAYERGAHIYNPHDPKDALADIASMTVIGPNALEADRFATAAFAMGKRGIEFIEDLPAFEGYAIDRDGIAIMTSGFGSYLAP